MNKLRFNARREGFALAAAVLAMLVVGAIVTGGFYAASQEKSIAKATDAGDLAMYIAETGMNEIVGLTTASTLSGIAISTPRTIASTPITYNGSVVGNYSGRVVRLASNIWMVDATGTVTLPGPYAGAQRELAQLIKIRSVDFDNNTAVQVFGNLTVGGSSDIDGSDWVSSSWTGCSPTTSTSAVLANPTTSITTQGSGNITGTITRQAMDSIDFNVFGDMSYQDVAAMADYQITAGATVGPQPYYLNGACDKTNYQNWGAPTQSTNVCFSWFPIIHALGDLRISSSGTGQGILLVDGNLDVSGGFTFYGAVVVQGQIRMTGTGGHINGTLITYGDGDLGSTSTTLGNSVVQYSSCAISRAVLGNDRLSHGYPIANRSWFDISNVQNSY